MIEKLLNQAFYDDNDSTIEDGVKEPQDQAFSLNDKRTLQYEKEYAILKDSFAIQDDQEELTVTFTDLLKILPRSRKRSDSYKGLVSYLQKNKNLKLNIITMKTKKIFFGGKLLDADTTLKAAIQNLLDAVMANAFYVAGVVISKNEIAISVFRQVKDYYEPDEGCATLDDTVILSGHLEQSDVRIPIQPHPFCDMFHYHFPLSDIQSEYNELIKDIGMKLKGLEIESDEKMVVYRYKF